MVKYSQYEQKAITLALQAIRQVLVHNDVMCSPEEVEKFLKLNLADEPEEWFAVLFLNSQHRLISFEKLFRGTIDSSHVHIRVVARRALELNAAALILAHNHPSGIAEPSDADQRITTRVKDTLNIFDIRVLDHVIVSPNETCSFARRGLL